MVISPASFEKPKIILNGCELEVVDNFKYLGSIEESNGDITEELARRRQAMGMFYWTNECVYQQGSKYITVVPNALYSSQVWPVRTKSWLF
jgi:hypothetical protein